MKSMRLASGEIFINDMLFHARHGVEEQERLTGGDFMVSVRARYPLEKAAGSDDVADTLNYATLYEIVRREMLIPSRLLEHVAGRIGRSIIEAMPLVEELTVELTKKNPPMGADCAGAGVSMRWTKSGN